MEPDQYLDMEVADDTYKVGHHVRIMNESGYAYDNENMVELSGTIIRCAQERNDSSHITVFYVLLDEFETYGPLIVVKGTPSNLCCCGEELQHHAMCSD